MKTLDNWDWKRGEVDYDKVTTPPPKRSLRFSEYGGCLGDLDKLIQKGEARLVKKSRLMIEFYN